MVDLDKALAEPRGAQDGSGNCSCACSPGCFIILLILLAALIVGVVR